MPPVIGLGGDDQLPAARTHGALLEHRIRRAVAYIYTFGAGEHPLVLRRLFLVASRCAHRRRAARDRDDLTPRRCVFVGGGTVPIRWTASDDTQLRSFDVQASFNGGRVAYGGHEPAEAATSYDWTLPASTGVDDLRIRVVARDQRFGGERRRRPRNVDPAGRGWRAVGNRPQRDRGE